MYTAPQCLSSITLHQCALLACRYSQPPGDPNATERDTVLLALDGSPLARRLGSRVVSLSLGGVDNWPQSTALDPPANITFTNVSYEGTPVCAFFSFQDYAWLTDGVSLVSADGTTVICSCSHLTNFAVLTNVDGAGTQNAPGTTSDDAKALAIITYVGLAVSLACYSAVVVTFAVHRKLRTLGKVVLCNICVSLSFGEATFVAGIIVAANADSPSHELCTSLGVTAHFFLLAAFGWMLCEASFIHTNFTSVFKAFVRNEQTMLRKYIAFAYGVPAVIVALTAIFFEDACVLP
jgi:hypothetical protein